MKTVNFTSYLADEMAHFVKFKQSSGFDYRCSAKLLFRFDQHLVVLLFKSKVLTRTIFQNYFETINHLLWAMWTLPQPRFTCRPPTNFCKQDVNVSIIFS